MGVYGIAVLSFFSSGISVILILMCGIAVSSSPAVCGFSSFWLTVFEKKKILHGIAVLFIFALLSKAGQYFFKKKLVGNPRSSNDQAF